MSSVRSLKLAQYFSQLLDTPPLLEGKSLSSMEQALAPEKASLKKCDEEGMAC